MSKGPQLSKLNLPSAAGLVPRPRLFAELDAARSGRFVWIGGSAGSGKTSLASTWLAARRLRHVWYHVDAGDADPAALFYFLGLAASRFGGRKPAPLPRLTPDRLPGLDVFALRFFEALFARMGPGSVLVLDDCHTVATTSPVFPVIAHALQVLPAGQLVIGISREMLPAPLARWSADAGYRWIGAEDLRLTDAEARAIARGLRIVDAAEPLNQLVQGWPAGLRLLLDARRAGRLPADTDAAALEPLFDYFAAEVLDGKPPAIRDFLLRTAIAPRVSPDLARALSGNDEAPAILESLHRQQLFINRRGGGADQPVYEYHALFRRFLLERGRQRLGADERVRLAQNAARQLEEARQVEDAAALLIDIHAWPELTRLVCTHAPRLAAEGRFATIGAWTAAVPAPLVDTSPWLLYWSGICRARANPDDARRGLEAAYSMFARNGDVIGRFLALAGVLATFFEAWGDQTPVDRWIAELEELLVDTGGVIPTEVEIPLIASASAIAMMRRPDHPVVRTLVNRSLSLVRTVPDVDQRVAIAFFAASHQIWVGEFAQLHAIGSELVPLVDRSVCWRWATFGVWFGCVLWQEAEHEAAFAALDRALSAAREHGFPLWEPFIQLHIAFTALSAGDLDCAKQAVAAGLAATRPSRTLEIAHFRAIEAYLLMLMKRSADAIALAEQNLPIALRLGAPFHEATLRVQLAQMLMLEGRHADARAHFRAVLAIGQRTASAILRFQALMMLAWSHFDTGDTESATALLREALTIGAAHNYMNCHPWWIPRVMARLCERALAAGLEPEYVRRLIRKRGLTPHSLDPPDWPWPIEIRALGGFTILRDGVAVAFRGKRQQRVLDLLKAIVAFGGRSVSVDALQEAVWPDADGDAAQGAFEVTLHRLRKLLGHDDALVLSGGRVGLGAAVCHLDTLAFERALQDLDVRASAGRTTPDAPTLERSAQELIRRYPGPLLAGEPEHAWLLAPRERLASRFAHASRALGDRLMEAGLCGVAARLYRHAIDVEPGDEDIYRRLIQILIEDGNVTEALRLYARCESDLAASAGLAPSREIQALIAALRRPS